MSREAGPVKGGKTVIAFVDDPTGYKFELIQREGKAIPEPLAQVGSCCPPAGRPASRGWPLYLVLLQALLFSSLPVLAFAAFPGYPPKNNPCLPQVMLRVGDLDAAIAFYTQVLGMRLLRTRDNPEFKYTLAFLGGWGTCCIPVMA